MDDSEPKSKSMGFRNDDLLACCGVEEEEAEEPDDERLDLVEMIC